MAMNDNRRTGGEDGLGALFAAARAADPRPGDDFLARLVAVAEAMQPATAPPPGVAGPARGWRGLLALLGGWPALGGMVAATVAGFWVGLAPPAGLTALAAEATGQVVDLGIYGEDDLLALLEG